MNFSELRLKLAPVVGSCLATIATATKPYIPPHPKGSVDKHSWGDVAIFMGPAHAMLTGQPSGMRKWGERQGETPFILHKGEMYLECFLVQEMQAKYFLNGTAIDVSQLRIREREELVRLRCFKIEHILRLDVHTV